MITLANNYKKHIKTALKIVFIFALIYVFIIFSFGYRIPWKDMHSDWPEFPSVNNSKFVICKADSFGDRNYKIMRHNLKDGDMVYSREVSGKNSSTTYFYDSSFHLIYHIETERPFILNYLTGELMILYDTKLSVNDYFVSYNFKSKTAKKIFVKRLLTLEEETESDFIIDEGILSKKLLERKYKKEFIDSIYRVRDCSPERLYLGKVDSGYAYLYYDDSLRNTITIKNFNKYKSRYPFLANLTYSYTVHVGDYSNVYFQNKNNEFYSIFDNEVVNYLNTTHVTKLYPIELKTFEDSTYSNIRLTGKVVTGNEFTDGGAFIFFSQTGGPTLTGKGPSGMRFIRDEIDYMYISIGNQKGDFKLSGTNESSAYSSFSQINSPRQATDTLFFIYDLEVYKAYLK